MTGKTGGLVRQLIADQILSSAEALHATELARNNRRSVAAELIATGGLSGMNIACAASRQFALPYLDIRAFDLTHCPLDLMSSQQIRKLTVLPLGRRGNRLYLAVADPGEINKLKETEFQTTMLVTPIVVAADDLDNAIENVLTQALPNPSPGLIEKSESAIPGCRPAIETSIVKTVNKFIADAVRQEASDIHIEPYENTFRVRYRIDGKLVCTHTPNPALAARITSRIKVMAKLNIAERRMPQDGRMSVQLGSKHKIHIRVSTLPTIWGEKIVLRLLDADRSCPAVESLGLEPSQLDYYLAALRQQQGMILISGPTGSGKSVSLYAGLKLLNDEERNISTAEDPIEVNIEGINQLAVNNRVGLDFATALRAFLRQDPDVVMVGEIRDIETAEIAVRAAQTGHLVLSTLHTNGAAEIVTRLRSMGIPPYNLATSVKLVIAQRLVRLLCRHCKELTSPPENLIRSAKINSIKNKELKVYRPIGCERCNKGFRGRTGIYEVVPITNTMSQLIMGGGNAIALNEEARKEGFPSLREAALFKVAQGLISIEEAYRLT